jgi:hypothetical protein
LTVFQIVGTMGYSEADASYGVFMTGAYVRVERDGEWKNVEVEHLTEEELKEKFLTRSPEELVSWLNMTCSFLRRLQPLLADLERDGIIARAKATDV